MRSLVLLAAVAGPLVGCVVHVPPGRGQIVATGAGSDLGLSPRPADCRIDFFRTKAPERAYDEVATLHYGLALGTDAAAAQEDLRLKACELGADAVVVTRDFIAGSYGGPPAMMTGTALSYRDAREGHRIDHAMREAARREADQKRAEERRRELAAHARPAGVPADYVPALLRRTVIVRATPERIGPERGELQARREVWVSSTTTNGHRRVIVPGERSGFVEDDALAIPPSLAKPEAGPAPAPAAAPPAPPRVPAGRIDV